MARVTEADEGLILDIRPRGENHRHLHILGPQVGSRPCLWRLRRQASAYTPDLFDRAQFLWERASSSGVWFVQTAELLERPAALSRSYATLDRASAWARIVRLNATHVEDTSALYALALDAFQAFARGAPAPVVYLKALYRFARQEGYPVKEGWLPGLPKALGEQAVEFLRLPSEETAGGDTEARALGESLEGFLRQHSDLWFDEPP